MTDAELAEAELNIADAEEAVGKGQVEGEQLQRLLVQAEQWRAGAGQVDPRPGSSTSTPGSCWPTHVPSCIEEDWARLRGLKVVVPRSCNTTARTARATGAGGTKKSENLAAELASAWASVWASLSRDLDEKRQQRQGLEKTLSEAEQREQVVGSPNYAN